MTTDNFIVKSKEIFNNPNWDYSETKYECPNVKVKIRCLNKDELGREHGYFEQEPYSHLQGHGCSKCSHRSSKYEVDLWLAKAKLKNENKFDFLIEEYENQHQRVECVCHKKDNDGNEHGSFFRTAKQIIMGTYCPKCRGEKRKEGKGVKVLKQLREIHNDEYEYPNFVYESTNSKIVAVCHKKDKNGVEHGIFTPTLCNHLTSQTKCPKCMIEKNFNDRKLTYEDFIRRANGKHKGYYDYSLIKEGDIDGVESKVNIICPIHGEFKMRVHNHLGGQGCQACGVESAKAKTRLGNEEWLRRFNKTHNNKYEYILDREISSSDKIQIKCPIHGIFTQKAQNHWGGQGCPVCRQSHLENEVMTTLINDGIEHLTQHKFKWLGRQSLDFYLPQYNIAIECQGSQHFEKDKFYKDLRIVQERDLKKRTLCQENNVELIYYLNTKYNEYVKDLDIPYFNTTDELINYIKKKEGYESSI